MYSLKNRTFTCDFDENGRLVSVSDGKFSVAFDGMGFDYGCDEKMALGLLQYESMLNFRTWNLPAIQPTDKKFSLVPVSVLAEDKKLSVTYKTETADVCVTWSLGKTGLESGITLTNTTEKTLYLNTCSFILTQKGNAEFDFPANAPIWHCRADQLKEHEVVQTGLINAGVHARVLGGDLNLLFVDKIEKWGCGVYREGNNTVYVYNAGLEADLPAGKSLTVGSLYIDISTGVNPYLRLRKMVESLGYKATQDGIHDGVMYSCHPSGTMDRHFPLKQDLFQYAEYLPKLKEMGVDHVWLLPVFYHDDGGVYHSIDQGVIDKRYGGEEGCKYYCDKAHELGMTILFDYVPHGPAPDFQLVKDNPEWPSKKRDGSLQDEWECVSMDYNHPGYQEYTAELVHDHVNRFGVDGARIDCAMGGLSNWRPYKDNRPSGDSVLAGVHITEAIRNGFLRGGKESFILPENFNPLPNYYHCTDLFYGMSMYRALVDLESLLIPSPELYVKGMVDYLERESWFFPADYHVMRFLGNHDTVSWVWQCGRAAKIYGDGGAKALFAMISLINGVPMIYQGDEDPSIIGNDTENLYGFFKDLFHARKKYLPKGSNETTYLHTETPVMAFYRETADVPDSRYQSEGKERVLVLINFSAKSQPVPKEAKGCKVLCDSAGAAKSDGDLAPYAYRILGGLK